MKLPVIASTVEISRLEDWDGRTGDANPPKVICVGTFDGVHRGHQAILAQGKLLAADLECPLWALSFHPHPKTIVMPRAAPKLLTEPSERVALLEAYGANHVVHLHFDDALAQTTAEHFAQCAFLDSFNARAVVVGEDFGFGRSREGNADFLRDWGDRTGVHVEIVKLVSDGESDESKSISSSIIRNHLTNNEFSASSALLGHPYPVSGQPTPGDGRGREIGYPTWNLALSDIKLPPPVGVYAAWTARPTPQPAMAYYGSNPTFGEHSPRLELNVLGGSEQDRTPQGPVESVWLCDYLRPEIRFDSAQELINQLAEDERITRKRLLKPNL